MDTIFNFTQHQAQPRRRLGVLAGAREWGQGNFLVIEVDAKTDIPKEMDRLL